MLETKSNYQPKLEGNRSFGVTIGIVFLLVGAYSQFTAKDWYWSYAIGAAFLATALLAPQVLQPLNRFWHGVGLVLHKVTNPIIMFVIFVLVILPFGIAFKLMGRDTMHREWPPRGQELWRKRADASGVKSNLDKQF